MTPSQFKNWLRQAESQQRQAVNRYNHAVRQHNQRVRQGVRDWNAAIERYNREVRAHNARLRSNQQRLRNELGKMQAHSSTRLITYRTSVERLAESYERLDASSRGRTLSPQENYFLDLSEREAANSASLFNELTREPAAEDGDGSALQATEIADEIAVISEDLDGRWRGALFSLSPKNPEAARHFCTSVREIFSQVLEQKAPDGVVFAAMPECDRTPQGNATRRSKLTYLLSLKGIHDVHFGEFANENIENIIDLFDILNAGTHGSAGRYDLPALVQVKKRVEGGLLFLCRLAA